MRRASRPAETLPALIDKALPRRPLKVNRDPLINAIVRDVEKWKSLSPQIKPYADKVKALAKIADGLEKALETAGGKLRALDVDEDIKQRKARNAALGINGPGQPLGGTSPAVDLYLIAWRTIDGVRRWNRIYRPRKGRAPTFSASLSKNLEEWCRERAGLSNNEFADFLQTLSGQHGLPEKLSPDTLKKRRARARKGTGTK